MILRITSLCLLSLLAIAGCQPETTSPRLDGRPLSLQDADRQYKARLLVLENGKTTRDQIISVMGDPDRVTDDKQVIMYYWTVKDKDEELIRRSFVIAKFDANDVLVKHRLFEDENRFGGPKLPDDALAEFLDIPKK